MVDIKNWINENYSDLQIEEIYNHGQELQGDLTIENYPNLKKIVLTNAKQITKLEVHNCPLVERIDIYNNKIGDLDISELANLEYLHIGNNKLTKLNVSQNKKLKTLICFNNPLESLEGVEKLGELSYFNASNAWKINNNLVNQTNLSSDYSYWPTEIQQKRRELENLRITFEETASLLNGEIQNLEKKQIQGIENKIKELELKEVNYQTQIQNLEREKDKNLQEINNLSRKKEELEREVSKLKNNLSEAKEKIKKLESDLEKGRSDYRKQVEKKDKEIRELKEKLEKDTKKFEEEKNRIIAELNSVKKEIPNETEKKLMQFATWSSWEEEDYIQIREVLKELETGEGQNVFISLDERIDWNKLSERYTKLRKTFIDLVKTTKQKNELTEQSKKLGEDFKKLSSLLGTENSLESLKKKLNDNKEEIEKVRKENKRLQEEENQAKKLFKIEEVEPCSDYIRVELNKPVSFRDSDSEDRIYLANRYPFDQYRIGDELEINADGLKKKDCSENLNDISLVKKVARGKMSLYDWWQEKKITYSERRKLLGISEIDSSPWFSLSELKRLLHYEELVEKNREKVNIKGKIWRVILFSTWFNKDCVMIVNGQPSDEYDYSVNLIIYEFSLKSMPEILEVIKFSETYSEVEDVRDKIYSLEARLNSNNPITYKTPSLNLLYKDEYRLLNVWETNIYSTSNDDLKDNPDKYIKPFDVVKTFDLLGELHTIIYLGNKKACHVLDENAIIEWGEFYGYYGNPDKIIRYHLVIPYKKNEKIIEHIARANLVAEKYHSVRGGFDLKKNNCEHFANLCVYGIDISEHHEIANVKKGRPNAQEVKKIDAKEELKKNDKFFSELITDDKKVENKIKEITKWVKKEKVNKNLEERLEAQVLITPKDGYYIKK